MTKYGKEMLSSMRRPPAGGLWTMFVVSLLAAIVLAVVAEALDEAALWIMALVVGTVAIGAWYALAVAWARRRKRLWG